MFQSTILIRTLFKEEKNRLDFSTEQSYYQLFLINSYLRQQKKSDIYSKSALKQMNLIMLISKRECKKR